MWWTTRASRRRADDATHDADIRQRFGLAVDAKFFFLPARFVTKKNIPLVLRAYASYLSGLGPDKEWRARAGTVRPGALTGT